jgi:hypothetical protein
MELVNSQTAYRWDFIDVDGVKFRGVPEKQGYSFHRAGLLAAQSDPSLDPDTIGKAVRQQLRPLSWKYRLKAIREHATLTAPAFPHAWIVESVNVCNRACPFCTITVMKRFAADGKDIKGVMDWGVFQTLMAECAEHDTYGISLYQLGEPFLWHGRDADGSRLNIGHMVNAAKRQGKFKVCNLSTNGDVPNLACVLGSELDDLIISIDGMTEATYNANRPSTTKNDSRAFQRTLERVHAFLEQKARLGLPRPYVVLQCINKQDTAAECADFVRYWLQVEGVDAVLLKNLDGMNAWLGDRVVSPDESAAKMAKVASMPCQHIFSVGSAVVDGTYNGCCHDALTELTDTVLVNGVCHRMGVTNTRFADWWQGQFMTQLRREHMAGEFRQPCKNCAERDVWA